MKWIHLVAIMAAFIVLALASPDDTAGKADPKGIADLQKANQTPASAPQEQQNVQPNEVQQKAQEQYEKIKQQNAQNSPQSPAPPTESQPETQTQNQQPEDNPEAEPSAPPPTQAGEAAQPPLAERIRRAREAEKNFLGNILWMFRPRPGVATSCSLRGRANQPPPPNGHWIVLPESMGVGYCGRVVTVQRPVALALRGGTLNLRRTTGVVWDLCNDCVSLAAFFHFHFWHHFWYRLC